MKRRLVLAIAGVAAAAVALFALPLAAVLQRSYRSEELLRLQRDTVAATRGIDLTAGGHDQVELPPSSDRLAIYAAGRSRIAGRGPAIADAASLSALRTRRPAGLIVDGRLVVAVPLLSGERVTGVVRAERSPAHVAGRVHRAWLALSGLAAVVVALAAFAALALGRQLVGPLERLAAAARRVGEGDFAARAAPAKIPEIDDVARALNSSSRRVGDLVSRERTFSADASHQLRTPLSALRLELEALLLESPEHSTAVGAALTQVDRLEGTIETLLAVARGTPRGQQTTDLGVLMRDLEERWRGVLAAQARPLRASLEVDPAMAAMSPAVLGEITDVLMHNAVMHGRGAVTVVVRQTGNALALEISDRGPGFGAEPDTAFARGSGEGHGIGLALARSLAYAEGARLQITHPGPSPTVSLILPSSGNGRTESGRDATLS